MSTQAQPEAERGTHSPRAPGATHPPGRPEPLHRRTQTGHRRHGLPHLGRLPRATSRGTPRSALPALPNRDRERILRDLVKRQKPRNAKVIERHPRRAPPLPHGDPVHGLGLTSPTPPAPSPTIPRLRLRLRTLLDRLTDHEDRESDLLQRLHVTRHRRRGLRPALRTHHATRDTGRVCPLNCDVGGGHIWGSRIELDSSHDPLLSSSMTTMTR